MDVEMMTVKRFNGLDPAEKARILKRNPCPADVIRAGVGDENWWVRMAAVGNPGAPEDVIRAGVGDEYPVVRAAAVGNPGAPEDVIRAGAEDRARWVRAAAATSRWLTAEMAVRLSRSPMVAIQEALADNPVVPERIRVVARLKAEAGRM